MDEATGLYEYGFRWYDPSIARFTGVDPIADQFAWVSVYNYAENEPIANIDLHGLQKVSINIAGQMILNGTSYKVAGTSTIDIGNNNSLSYSIALDGLGGVSGTYSNESGFKSSSGVTFDYQQLLFEVDKPRGVVIPKWAARIGLNKAIKSFTPSNLEEALSISREEDSFNTSMRFLLNGINELIDQDILIGLYDYDGSKGQAINESGQLYDREFTSVYKGQFNNVHFGDQDIGFAGKIVVSYTDQQTLQKDTHYEDKLPSVIRLKMSGL